MVSKTLLYPDGCLVVPCQTLYFEKVQTVHEEIIMLQYSGLPLSVSPKPIFYQHGAIPPVTWVLSYVARRTCRCWLTICRSLVVLLHSLNQSSCHTCTHHMCASFLFLFFLHLYFRFFRVYQMIWELLLVCFSPASNWVSTL